MASFWVSILDFRGGILPSYVGITVNRIPMKHAGIFTFWIQKWRWMKNDIPFQFRVIFRFMLIFQGVGEFGWKWSLQRPPSRERHNIFRGCLFRGNDFLGWEIRKNVLKISQNRELTYPTWGSSENLRLKSAGGKRGCVSSQTFTDMRIVKGSWWFHVVNPRLGRP